jgi:hypothetical protein
MDLFFSVFLLRNFEFFSSGKDKFQGIYLSDAIVVFSFFSFNYCEKACKRHKIGLNNFNHKNSIIYPAG